MVVVVVDEEEEGLFTADAVKEVDAERHRATQAWETRTAVLLGMRDVAGACYGREEEPMWG